MNLANSRFHVRPKSRLCSKNLRKSRAVESIKLSIGSEKNKLKGQRLPLTMNWHLNPRFLRRCSWSPISFNWFSKTHLRRLMTTGWGQECQIKWSTECKKAPLRRRESPSRTKSEWNVMRKGMSVKTQTISLVTQSLLDSTFWCNKCNMTTIWRR